MGYEWIGPLVQLVGGAVGEGAAAGDRAAQLEVLKRAQAMFGNISIPELKSIVAQTVPDSGLSSYQPNASYEGNQNDVLGKLSEIEKGGGFGVEDKADLARIGQQVAAQQRAAQSGLNNALRTRGAMGSGEDYASRVALAQSGTQQANQAGLDQSKIALQRRLQAMSQRATLAGSLRGQDFSEAQGKSSAQDAINTYNAGARNAAALANNQNLVDTTKLELAKAQGASGIAPNLSTAYGNQASNTQQFWAGMGKAGSSAANAYLNPGSTGSAGTGGNVAPPVKMDEGDGTGTGTSSQSLTSSGGPYTGTSNDADREAMLREFAAWRKQQHPDYQ